MTDEGAIAGELREITAIDGYVLRYRHYRPAGLPRAYVIGLHGIQSHSGWYEWSSRRLAEAGFDVRFLDRRGAGLNDRTLRQSESASQHCLDVVSLLAQLESDGRSTDIPVVVLSISWGGKLAAGLLAYWRATSRKMRRQVKRLPLLGLIGDPGHPEDDAVDQADFPVAGMAFLYPAIFTRFDPNLAQRIGIRTANRLGLGRKTVLIPLDAPALFTDNPQKQAFIRDDSLALRRVSLSFLKATLDLTRQAKSLPNQNPPPVFLALAGRDDIVDLPRTRRWSARLPAETTRIIEYPEARHTLEFAPCREQFVADLIDWIESLT